MDLEGLAITKDALRAYNRRRKMLAVISIMGGFFLVFFTFLFFWGMTALAIYQFDADHLQRFSLPLAVVLTVVVVASGFLRYRRGQGSIDYWESVDSFLPRGDTAGAVVVDHYAARVTAPAYAVSQLILAGPRYFLQGLERLQRGILEDDGLARSMESVRAHLDHERKFHPVSLFAKQMEPLMYLGWMGVATLAPKDNQLMVRISLDAQSKRI